MNELTINKKGVRMDSKNDNITKSRSQGTIRYYAKHANEKSIDR